MEPRRVIDTHFWFPQYYQELAATHEKRAQAAKKDAAAERQVGGARVQLRAHSARLSVCLSVWLSVWPAGSVSACLSVRSAEGGVCSRGLCVRACWLGCQCPANATQVYGQRAGAAKELQDELQGRLARQDGELAIVRAKVRGAAPSTTGRRAGLCRSPVRHRLAGVS